MKVEDSLLVERDVDVDRLELGLNVRRGIDGERHVAARDVAIGERGRDAGLADGVGRSSAAAVATSVAGQSSPSQANGIAHGVKWVATSEPGGR